MARIKNTGVPCPICAADRGQACSLVPTGTVHSERIVRAIKEASRLQQMEHRA